MESVEIIGFVAGFLTTLSTLPQVIKSYKTKSTEDISWGYLALLWTGLALWTIYGLMISSLPVILTNSVSVFLFTVLAVLKFKCDKKQHKSKKK